MQLPGQKLPLQQRKPPGCQELCMLSLTTVIQSLPLHSASSPSLKSIYPHSVSYTELTSSIFRITVLTEFCLQINPVELTDWENVTTSRDFN